MNSEFRIRALAVALVLGTAPPAIPALANDSEAEWAVGGIALKANSDISMDNEDLYISASEVRVDYVYTNHASEDRDVVISFPLPAIPGPEGWYDYGAPDSNSFDFTTTVDGEKVSFEIHDRAIIGARDVTDLIKAEGLGMTWYRVDNYRVQIDEMSAAKREHFIELGLLRQNRSRLQPTWQVQRHYLRVQTFPAGKSVRVSHRYTPKIGRSIGGTLEPFNRNNDPDSMTYYIDKWCVNDGLLSGLDKKLRDGTEEKPIVSVETWLGYVLSSGANWAGPIKDFRLVVDKGDPGNLVSFCMDGVKKISPTQFEVRKTDFEPTRDLNVLILSFPRPREES